MFINIGTSPPRPMRLS